MTYTIFTILTNGSTQRNIRIPMKSEQIGSAICQPNICIKNDDTITPTLPSVSARICRNTPVVVVVMLLMLLLM